MASQQTPFLTIMTVHFIVIVPGATSRVIQRACTAHATETSVTIIVTAVMALVTDAN